MRPPPPNQNTKLFFLRLSLKKKKKKGSSARILHFLICWIHWSRAERKKKKDHSLLWLILMFGKLFSLWLGWKSRNIHICEEIVWSFGARNIHLSVCPLAPGRPGARGCGTQQVLYWGTIEMSWQDTKKTCKACLVADFQWDFIIIGLF